MQILRSPDPDFGPPVYGARGQIGLLVPANNSVIEPEFWSVLPHDIAVYATRLLVKGNLTPDVIRRMESLVANAAETIAATGVGVTAYCDMVTTFIMEPGWNEEAVAKSAADTGIKTISAWTALRESLDALNVRRFALLTPYPAAIHATARPFFESRGYKLTGDITLDILAVREVPTVGRLRIEHVIERLDVSGADALVILATDLPTFKLITELEQKFDRPVLTSNQTLLWSAIRKLGQYDKIESLGKLFSV